MCSESLSHSQKCVQADYVLWTDCKPDFLSAFHLPCGFQKAFLWDRYFPQAGRIHFLETKETTARITYCMSRFAAMRYPDENLYLQTLVSRVVYAALSPYYSLVKNLGNIKWSQTCTLFSCINLYNTREYDCESFIKLKAF